MGYTEFDLAKRIHNTGKDIRVEIAEITSILPLKLKIGNAEYDSTLWEIYEPYFEDKDAEIKKIEHETGVHSGASVNCSVGSISQMTYSKETIENGKYKERKSYMKYNVGDKVAVQQMVGDKSFIILCKIRRVE